MAGFETVSREQQGPPGSSCPAIGINPGGHAIEGFTYEEGFTWRIEVERVRITNPPADASSFLYRLQRVVSKTQVRQGIGES